jgi:hypothetical protein
MFGKSVGLRYANPTYESHPSVVPDPDWDPVSFLGRSG